MFRFSNGRRFDKGPRPRSWVLAGAAALLLIAVGCATAQQRVNDLLQPFLGQHIDNVLPQMVQIFGVIRPDRVVDDGLGGKVYFWQGASSDDVASIRLFVNEKGIVWKFQTRGQPSQRVILTDW